MIKVGITGEMGSGKSFCAKQFEQLGIPVFYTDDSAKRIVNSNLELKKKISEEFGNVYDEDGMVISTLLRSIVFVEGAEDKLKRLNEICHPYVFQDFTDFCQKNKEHKYIIAESAILYESGMDKALDEVIYVFAKEELRIKRTFERSGFPESDYRSRMKSQIPSGDKMKLADYIIFNNEGDDVKKQVDEVNSILISS
jgi:dephospho-CoA kinase